MSREELARALRRCGRDVSQVKHLHSRVIDDEQSGSSRIVAHELIRAYSRCGAMAEARRVFDDYGSRDVVTWNILLAACSSNGHLEAAAAAFERMPQRDTVAWTSMVRCYAQLGLAKDARRLFDAMPDYSRDMVAWNTMLAGYARCGRVKKARRLFVDMPARDLVSWTTMVAAYAQNGCLDKARRCFDRMPQLGIVAANTIIAMYASAGLAAECNELFAAVPPAERNAVTFTALLGARDVLQPDEVFDIIRSSGDVVSWTRMLQAQAMSGSIEQAKSTFDTMPSRDAVAWTTLLAAFAQKGQTSQARAVFDRMPLRDLVTGNAMVAGYAHQGRVAEVEKVLEHVPGRDIVTWTSILAAFAQSGEWRRAITEFHSLLMDGTGPMDEILLLIVLGTCSHAGLIEEARYRFLSMSYDHGIEPIAEHYYCMVDLLARNGKLNDAEELLQTMPFLPSESAWSSFLAACNTQHEVDRGCKAATSAIRTTPDSGTSFMLLANMHARVGADSRPLQRQRKIQGSVSAGTAVTTTIEIEDRVHRFVAGDPSSFAEKEEEVLAVLSSLSKQLKRAGLPHTKNLCESASVQCSELLDEHSEMLAVALGVALTNPGTRLCVWKKNQAVCPGCHDAIKMLSGILGRRVRLEEPSFIHRFKHGRCSCEQAKVNNEQANNKLVS